jgi:methyl-accepting chemotaxis protein
MFLKNNKKEYEKALGTILDGHFDIEPNKKDSVIEKILILCNDLKLNKKDVKELICGILNIAVEMSSFDLKLKFYSNEIMKETNRVEELNQTVQTVFEEISASIEEIDANTREYNNVFQKVATRTEMIHNDVEDNTIKVTEAKNIIASSSNLTEDMKNDVDKLIDTTRSIEQLLQDINGIAEKINILALNAAIEANRAGEHGRGFAVVATEIRNLSNNTKELVNSLSSFVERIHEYSDESAVSVKRTVEGVVIIKSSLTDIERVFFDISKNTKSIAEDIKNLTLSGEGLSQAISEASSAMLDSANIAGEAALASSQLVDISEEIKSVGNSIEELERIVIDVAGKSGEMATSKYFRLDNDRFVHRVGSAIGAHKDWIRTLENMVTNMKVVPLQTDDKRCAFGHFYHSVKPTNPIILETWQKVDDYHKKLHGSGDKAIEFIGRGNREGALRLLEETKKDSLVLINLFQDMVKIAEELTEKEINVF